MFEQLWRYAINPIAHQVAESARMSLRRRAIRAMALLCATFAAAMGIAWISWTAFMWLARDNDPVLAAAIIGLVLLSAALATALFALKSDVSRPSANTPVATAGPHNVQSNDEVADAIATAEMILRGKASSGAILALVAGVSLGAFTGSESDTPRR